MVLARNQLIITSGLLLICFIGFISTNCEERRDFDKDYSWIDKIRDDSPRLFLNQTLFPEIKKRALNEERNLLSDMKERTDLLFEQGIDFAQPLTSNYDRFGTSAVEAAFLYHVLDDEKYLDLSKEILVQLIDFYHTRNENSLSISWYNSNRMMALTAYDWIYNSLTDNERTRIGYSLLNAINFMLENGFPGDNRLDIISGYYGTPALSWYAGLVFHEKGIDDDLAKKLLMLGYDNHIKLLEHRSNAYGDHGGAASGAMNYAITSYPWAEFNFLHTFNSATGLDITKEWSYIPYITQYAFWNWLPRDRQFGYGDNYHTSNNFPLSAFHIHLSQIVHFYGKTHPELISLAKWMKQEIEQRIDRPTPGSVSFTRFLLTNTHDEIKPAGPPEIMPKAMFFEPMGQIFMRSGSGPDDTYALFTAGGMLRMHRHYDNNNFVIFKKGFLALDSGNRPEPGIHLSHYYSRTVAHNCIIIRMPGEEMPTYWGRPAPGEEPVPPVPNDGGQNNLLGSEVIAFSENDHYVYIASDAADSYHEDKASLVLRQFVFLPPDHFVIFDRVGSTKPEYGKKWLLHTAAEPTFKRNEFFADHWEGRLFSRTLLPQDAELTKIGGPGKQFWSDGRNWPIPGSDGTTDLLGQWRVEVSPGKPNTDDMFLHLIQVGDTSLESMVVSAPVTTDDMTGLRFTHENKEYEVMFNTDKEAGGRISISRDGRQILKDEFSIKVEKQRGMF
jgi:hypothetical protein